MCVYIYNACTHAYIFLFHIDKFILYTQILHSWSRVPLHLHCNLFVKHRVILVFSAVCASSRRDYVYFVPIWQVYGILKRAFLVSDFPAFWDSHNTVSLSVLRLEGNWGALWFRKILA